MAYGVKYRAEWRATTRGVRDYVVEILEDGYTGGVSPLHLTGDCITITYGEVDESELKPIKSSEAEITALCMDDGNPYIELYTLDPAQYQVIITENGSLIWRGYLATGDYQQPLSKPPYTVRFRANDGLAVLKAMPYLESNGERFATQVSVAALFQRLLSPISDNIDVWNYTLLRPNQESATFDILSIPDESIYQVFGSEVPTYYDVLEAVLGNFGVQLCQLAGVWCIRSLDALANAANNGLLKVINVDAPSSYGYGLKADATLSVLSPLRKMTLQAQGGAEVDLTDVVRQPSNWQARAGWAPHKPSMYSYGKAVGISARGDLTSSYLYGSTAILLPYIFTRSNNTKITVSFDVFNGRGIDATGVYAGVWLREPHSTSNEVAIWTKESELTSAASQISFYSTTCYWEEDKSDATKSKWVKLADSINNPTSSKLGLQKVEIKKAPFIGSRPALSGLPKTSVTFEIPQIPEFTEGLAAASTWQLAIVVAVNGGNRMEMYITNLKVSASTEGDNNVGDININDKGIVDESYASSWRTSATAPSATALSPMLVDLSREERAYGYMVANNGIADKDVVGKQLYQLRNDTSYLIEGELDNSSLRYGVNNVFAYDGRKYYTNHVARFLKRGIASVQLREFTHLRRSNWSYTMRSVGDRSPRLMVGVNNALFYINKADQLYFTDAYTLTPVMIGATSPTAEICSGVDCMILRDSDYVAAYGISGNLLSKVEDFSDATVSAASFYATAKYDASKQIWLASDGGRNVVMCDRGGFVLSTWQCTTPSLSTSITDAEILPYHGGFIYRFYSMYNSSSDANSKYYCFWHCYSIHLSGEFEQSGNILPDNNIRLLSDKLIATLGIDGKYTLSYIDKGNLKDGVVPISTMGATNEILSLNNAIAITRGSAGIAIYDCRNTGTIWYTIGRNPEMIALCNDYLAMVTSVSGTGYTITVNKIHPKIASYSSTNMILSNGEEANYSRREASNLYQDVTDGGNPVDE